MKNLNQTKIENYLVDKEVTWKFNPPSNPWLEGSWESTVKLTKQSLKSVLQDRPVIDVEFTINSRPILHFSDDINNLDVLRSNYILTGTRLLYFNPNIKCEKIDSRIKMEGTSSIIKNVLGSLCQKLFTILTNMNKIE